MSTQQRCSIAIVGLGNELMTDDGVGIHAIRLLQQDSPEGVILAEVGTSPLKAQDLLEEVDEVIAIDAVTAGDKPGSVYVFDGQDAELSDQLSLHNLGIIGTLRLMPENQRPKVTILGVEPEIIDYGMELSPTVRNSLPLVVKTARKIANEKKENIEK